MDLILGGDPDAICPRYGITRAELDERLKSYQLSRRKQALVDHLTMIRVGRNEPCPCGSGKKYKKCCQPKHEEARRNLPPDRLKKMEELAQGREKLEKEVQKGFDLLFSHDFDKAQRFAERLLESYPEDDRLHDILANVCLASGDYDGAFRTCRRRWQIAQEEKAFFLENGFHKREGVDKTQIVHFYSPSTWLERFWIAQRARNYREMFPAEEGSELAKTVEKLKLANDPKRFPGRGEEGYEMRRKALAPVLDQLEKEGPAAIPYLLPLTYFFSWASVFVPDLLRSYGTDQCVKLLAELSMFRFPFFSQKCLSNLEDFGERSVPQIKQVLDENPVFDELKVGIIMVLGSIRTQESFETLAKLTEHENPYVVNWVADALERHQNPEALTYLNNAKERLGGLSKIGGAIRELAGQLGK